ncbi:hypothetical protein T484DRAFT_3236861 [Baffinella frigidus]|nr:hypothetical protein T484DRAFT_3236861 [Cryptophyta sp. CCMP2293]
MRPARERDWGCRRRRNRIGPRPNPLPPSLYIWTHQFGKTGDAGADAIASVLADERCSLKELNLSNNDITFAMSSVLAAAAEGGGEQRLETLSLDDNRPPPATLGKLPALIGAASHAGLRSLSLRNMELDDATAQHIAAALCLSVGDLQVLDLRENRGCSGKGRTALEGLGRLKRGLTVHL